ncbi:MAG: 50S ribosomal protein L13 [Candidatus Dependentiae bacterium]|nr:50S ribosomal protein L13 [Candidatus Dependentiae bacterium]
MEMNKAFFLSKEARCPQWCIIDAKGKVLGRMATQIADILRGKNKAYYTPHTDGGDYVVVINAEHVVLTGKKLTDKLYVTYSGWRSGRKETTAKDVLDKHPTHLIELAVKRMLPKNKLADQIFKKLKVYAGSEHPHEAQGPKAI